MVLRKKQLKEEYWPRLLKDNKKLHFLKTDFDKWVDEDEQDAMPEDDLGGMPGMGGMGGMPGMGDMSSMLGGSGLDFSNLGGDMGGNDDAEDDEEMPALEGEEEKNETSASKSTVPAESSGKAKIEEVS